MAKYYVDTPNGKQYIKTIDFAKGTIEFTYSENEAYKGRDGYYATPTKELIARNFAEDYPQVVNLKCSAEWQA